MSKTEPLFKTKTLTTNQETTYFIRQVKKYGNGAKINFLKQYIGKFVYVVVKEKGECEHESEKTKFTEDQINSYMRKQKSKREIDI